MDSQEINKPPQNIVDLISEKIDCLDDWMQETSESEAYENDDTANLLQLEIWLVGMHDIILSLPNSLRQQIVDETQIVFKRLENALKDQQNAITATEIIGLTIELNGKLKLCREALLNNNQCSPFMQTSTPGDKTRNIRSTVIAIGISLLMILLFEFLVYKIPLAWLTKHPNSYSLQASIVFLIPSVVIGLFKPRWRNWCWGTAVFGFVVLIISLLGGKNSP